MNRDEVVKTERVVLFTDIHNFSIAAKALAERQYEFLQRLYETLGDIVVEHQGELIKYLGDGFFGVFPAGLEVEAIASALAMRDAFLELTRLWELPADTELEVGVDAGEVFEGVFGHRTLRQRDVYGEVVNRAAMIGHHRGVAITKRVYLKVRNVYAVRRLPDVVLKWEDEPLKLWEVSSGEA